MAGLPGEVIDRLFVTYVANAGPGTQPVKRFKCLIEGCEREFPRKSAIKSHIQTHLDDKPFVCRVVDWYVPLLCFGRVIVADDD